MVLFRRGLPVIVFAVACSSAWSQIGPGSYDVFQSGTTLGWGGGTDNIWQATGGPGGSGDGFLQVTSFGGFGAGSHLAFHNTEARWTGNYAGANVFAVEAWVRNDSASTLSLRAVLFQTNTNRFTSKTAVTLAPFQGWTKVRFGLKDAELTRVLGTLGYSALMASVTQLMFRHDPEPPSSGGDPIAATIGIDRIHAVVKFPLPKGS